MIVLFYKLIIVRPQLKAFSQVPVSLQPKVHAMLVANGYDDNGDLIPPPKAPNVTADDINNVVVGIDATMEYAIDGASAYTTYNATTPPNLEGNHTIIIRTAGVIGVSNTSLPTILVFKTNPVTPVAPNVTIDDALNTVTGMDITMEYNLDSEGYIPYDKVAFDTINFNGVHTLDVRAMAEGINPVGLVTSLKFTANVA